MFTTIGTVLSGPTPKADRHSVRRGSRLAGRCEGTFWCRTDRQQVRRVVLAARRYELASRQGGRRNGPLGHVGLEVLELLGNLVSFKTGRLEPAILYLMGKLKRSRDAVVRALAALRTHGFLDWLRRYEPTGVVGRGPQVRQISNAYRLALPPRAARLLGIQHQNVPLADDLYQHLEDRRSLVGAYKGALRLQDLAVLEVDDDVLGRVLGELGRLVQERESAQRSETQSTNFL